jgi:plasmid replication initiation protein
VCLTVKPWSTQIDASVTQARTKITSASDPAQTKTELVALFTGAERTSRDAIAKVRKAGVPDADNGAAVASQFTAALTAAQDNFGRAAAGVRALPTTDRAAFYAGVVKVGDQLSKDNNASSQRLADVRSKDLEKAFADVSECR